MSIKKDKTLILNKIKEHYGFLKDVHFAKFLGIAPTTLSSWYMRNTMDYDLVFSKCVDIDGNWLLSGEGSILKKEVTHQAADIEKSEYQKKGPDSADINYLETIVALNKVIAAQDKTIQALEMVIAIKSGGKTTRSCQPVGTT